MSNTPSASRNADPQSVRRLAQIEALGRVAHALTGAEDAERTMEFVAAEGMQVFDAQRAAVYLFDQASGPVRCMVALGLSDRYVHAVLRHFHELPSGLAVMRGEPWFTRDARSDPHSPLRAEVEREGFGSVAALPLVFAGEAIGSLALYHDTAREWALEERRFAVAFADQAALAIGKSRLLDQVTRIKREWQSAFDGTGSGLAIVDSSGIITRANRFIAALAAVPVTSLPGLDLRTLFRSWPHGHHDPLLEAHTTGGRVTAVLEGREGQHLVLAASPRPEGGLVVGIEDVTELVRLEERFTRVVHTAHDAIVIAGPEGKVNFVNPAALELFGVARSELLGRPIAELLPEGTDEPESKRERGSRRFEAVIARGDGPRHVAVSSIPLEERGTRAGTVAVVRDVTQEHQAALALRRSETKFRALFAAAPLAIFTLDRDGRFHSVNRAALQMAGQVRRNPALSLRDFLIPAEAEYVEDQLEGSFRGETRDFILHFRRADGEVRQSAVIAVPVEEPDGGRAVLVIARDVTDEMVLRERLTRSEKMAALGQLVSGVAHELNNPLAGIAALAQAVLLDPKDDGLEKILETIRSEAVRAARIVTDLLTFARQRPLERTDTNLNEVIHAALAASPLLHEGGISWTLDLAEGLPAVSADAGQVRQVVTNLLNNAAQAMHDAAHRVGAIRTYADRQVVGCEVTDSGLGVAPELMQRIFEPFFTTKTAGVGTGLGLSISHGIIRAHGGDIHAQNRPEGGARFWFELPRDAPPEARLTDG